MKRRNRKADDFPNLFAGAEEETPAAPPPKEAEEGYSGILRSIRRANDRIADEERPETVLYTLSDGNLPALAAATGAFRRVRMGAAWWFNDTVQGIRKNLRTIMEYAALGTHFGMLTDSRSFSSYVRFEFFRRILADELGALVGEGRCDLSTAISLAQRVSYYNIKEALGL